MKNVLLSFVFCLVGSFCFAQDTALEDFDKIKISGNFVVELFNADKNGYDLNVLKGKNSDVVIGVDNGLLKVKSRYGYKAKKRLKANLKIYHDGISGLKVAAGANVKSKDPLMATDMEVDVSSGSTCDVVIEAKNADIDVSSGANCQVSGSSNTLVAEASSGARLDAQGLASKSVEAEASSGANMSVWAAESIKADASSGGTITYKGEPSETDIEKDKYSGGSISKM